jgi:methylenetetrahydrofolate reductase (NADPH)
LESALWRNAAAGLNNILTLSGDLPMIGNPKRPAGVFDLDSSAMLALISAMNTGLETPGRKGVEKLPACSFFPGCTVNPFKRNENELVPQYYKLLRKLRAGAKWLLPQLGYDMRKFFEVQRFLQAGGFDTPLVGNVYVLNRTVAKMFNEGKLPGCTVSDELYKQIEKYAAGADKGRAFFRELAAKQLAVFRGLGFAAAYLGGLSRADSFFEIIAMADAFAPDDWKSFYQEIQFSFPGEFFYFDESQSLPNPQLERETPSANITLLYRMSRLVHSTAFRKGRGLHPLFSRLVKAFDCDAMFCRIINAMAHMAEKNCKFLLYGCSDCGDCGLPDTAYLCPMNSCSKNMRNGPCGGSLNGRCEAGDKNCVWAVAYDRLKNFRELADFRDRPVITYDASLKGTSAWKNFYLERDHSNRENMGLDK